MQTIIPANSPYSLNGPLAIGKGSVSVDKFKGAGVEKVPNSLEGSNRATEQVAVDNKKQGLEFDKSAIAFLESKEGSSILANSIVTSQQTGQRLTADDGSRESLNSNLSKEQIPLSNQTAVSSYQQVGNLAQRESVQQMLGIDLFA